MAAGWAQLRQQARGLETQVRENMVLRREQRKKRQE
jgi:hypothetical protein